MKKRIKLLALALAVAMLLPAAALAAENEGESKELWMQWINWDEENYQPDSEIYRDTPQITPYDATCNEMHSAFYTCDNDGEKLTPVPADKLEADKGVTITPLCPGEKGKESYAVVSVAEWNKTYTISYNGYSIKLESRLPDLGLYSAPEATVENYIWNQNLGFTPLNENRSAYIISTCTDETRGRHMVDLAFAEDYADKDSFKLEKVNDNVYKVTLTGSVDINSYDPRLTVTWQDVQFIGGSKYAEPYDFGCGENASVLVSDKPVPDYDYENPQLYYNVKSDFYNTLTLKAGESKTVYLAFTYFDDEHDNWIMRNVWAEDLTLSDSKLKTTGVRDDKNKLTVSCDVPGTYTMFVYNENYAVIDAIYHENGRQYTETELQKWLEDTLYYTNGDGKLLIVTDQENWPTGSFEETTASFEEAFPGQKIEYHVIKRDPWYPVTVTVEAAEPEKLSFTDVDAGAWYKSAVHFVSGKGYMNGSSAATFNPNGKITGAEVTQILYNKEGKPAAADGATFQGIDGKWYAPAMLWAAGRGIITDTGDAATEPEKNVTREQIALMLYNYLGKPEGKADLSAFADAEQISTWAKTAMEWAVRAKVFNGSESGGRLLLDPAGTASRAQVAQILMNYFE